MVGAGERAGVGRGPRRPKERVKKKRNERESGCTGGSGPDRGSRPAPRRPAGASRTRPPPPPPATSSPDAAMWVALLVLLFLAAAALIIARLVTFLVGESTLPALWKLWSHGAGDQ